MHNVGHFRQGRYCSLWLLEPRLQCKKWTMLCVIFSFALNHHICLCWCCSLGFEMRHHYYQIGKRFLMLWGYINPHLSQHCRWLFGTQQHQSVLYSKLKSSSINFTKLRLLDFLGFLNAARVLRNVQKSNFLKLGEVGFQELLFFYTLLLIHECQCNSTAVQIII